MTLQREVLTGLGFDADEIEALEPRYGRIRRKVAVAVAWSLPGPWLIGEHSHTLIRMLLRL